MFDDMIPEDQQLFTLLKRQRKDVLLKLLLDTWNTLDEAKRREIFGEWIWQTLRENLTSDRHVIDVREFYDNSFRGIYFAPFPMDSHNYRTIPEKTEIWFNKMGDLLDMTCILAEQGEKEIAIYCFDKLFDLIDNISEGIVFAHEAGEWMIFAKYKYRDVYAKLVKTD